MTHKTDKKSPAEISAGDFFTLRRSYFWVYSPAFYGMVSTAEIVEEGITGIDEPESDVSAFSR